MGCSGRVASTKRRSSDRRSRRPFSTHSPLAVSATGSPSLAEWKRLARRPSGQHALRRGRVAMAGDLYDLHGTVSIHAGSGDWTSTVVRAVTDARKVSRSHPRDPRHRNVVRFPPLLAPGSDGGAFAVLYGSGCGGVARWPGSPIRSIRACFSMRAATCSPARRHTAASKDR